MCECPPAAPGCTELLLQLPRASLLQGDTGDAAHPAVTASPGLSETGLPRSGFCRFELPAENQGNWDVALICNASSGVQRHQRREELPTGQVSGHGSVAAAGTPSPCTQEAVQQCSHLLSFLLCPQASQDVCSLPSGLANSSAFILSAAACLLLQASFGSVLCAQHDAPAVPAGLCGQQGLSPAFGSPALATRQ